VKFTLKDYQRDAVADLLVKLDRARVHHHRDGQQSSISLSAATGAGKTVIAAAAIEALFYGSDDFEFDADPGAVVVWFSDDPSLNQQTRMRLRDASEKFTASDLVTIQPPFARPRLEPGRVYFLNTQRLSKSSLLVRGHVDDSDAAQTHLPATTPDEQGWTIWETIANTIDDDDLTLFLVLDEAHRGFDTRATREKPTIVSKLVNGHAGYPPVPIVWGISATIQRFKDAMAEAHATDGRRALDPVAVDPGRVQDSGLVKDTVVLDIPVETGNLDTTLVRIAARKLRASTERWHGYAAEQELTEPVEPLLVLQTQDTPDAAQIGAALDAITHEYPEIRGDAVRHVLGEHAVQRFGSWEVGWIEPQRVQESAWVKVLIAKTAISTGWDCPRAEVMVSFRPAKDETHITQLLGRMVRNPLARRVPGDDRLNAVECILPNFDRTTAGNVVKYLTGQLDEMPGPNKNVVLEPCELHENPVIPEVVWDRWSSLPTQTLPQRGARAVKRLVALAQALSQDRIRPAAIKEVEAKLHRAMDAFSSLYGAQLEVAIKEVWVVHVQRIAGKVGMAGVTYTEFVERADDRAIRSGFEEAKKAFGADVAQSYVNHLAGPDDDNADDDGLRHAYVRAAALAMVPEARKKIDAEADQLAKAWFETHRMEIKALPDVRKQEYEEIRALSTEPQRGSLSRPRSRIEDYQVVDDSGQIHAAELATLHLMADEDGNFPLGKLNDWEVAVVRHEIARPRTVGWYRNPPRATADSIAITYRDAVGNWRTMHPDFVFFREVEGHLRASIVDPHGHHLDDADLKLKALAEFADRFGDEFDRIEAVTKVGGSMLMLDMQRPTVRDAVVHGHQSALELYESDVGAPYRTAS
jgi:hypothetical protein